MTEPGPSTTPCIGLPIDASWHQVPSFRGSRPYTATGTNAEEVEDDDDGDDEDDERSEWEYSEDEELVTLDLGRWGQEHDLSVPEASQCAITGLDSATPWFQRGQVVYKGQWTRMLGTEILLERTRDTDGQPTTRPLPQRRVTSGEPSTTRSRIVFTPTVPVATEADQAKKPTQLVFPHVQGQDASEAPAAEPKQRAAPRPRKPRVDRRTYAQDWIAKTEIALERREVLHSRGELPGEGRMRMSQAELARRRRREESARLQRQAGAAAMDNPDADSEEEMELDEPDEQ